MTKNSLILCLVGVVLNSCSSTKTTKIEEKPKVFIEVNQANLTKGKSLYEAKCGSCHQLFEKSSYDAISWRKNVNSMYKRAGLNDLDKEFVYLYLTN